MVFSKTEGIGGRARPARAVLYLVLATLELGRAPSETETPAMGDV